MFRREPLRDLAVGPFVKLLEHVEEFHPGALQAGDLAVAFDQRGLAAEDIGETADGVGGVRLEGVARSAKLVLEPKFRGVDAFFDGEHADVAPMSRDETFENRVLFVVARIVEPVPLAVDCVEDPGIVDWQDDRGRVGIHAVLEGIVADGGFTFCRFGAAAFPGIGPVGSDFSFRD